MIKLYNGNGGEVEITPSDDSYRLTELMGADEVVLKFAIPDYLAISAGAYITYKGDRYEVESEDSVRMIHTEEYEYTVTFSSPRAHLRRYIVREKGGEGRITFFLTAKPREHLDLIVHNLNEREAGWSVGTCLDGSEKTIEYSTTNALDALQKLAEAYGTEWECEGRTLSLRKAEYHKDSPLVVSYGKGKGLLSGLERNPAEEQPVGTLYVTGTDRNIDPIKYKSKTLHLPEGATKTVGGRTYTVTSGGRAITVSGSAPGAVEGAFTDTDVYPSREGVVKTVTIRDKEKAFVDFTDPSIPADLDFEQCLILGREMKLTFQTGMLAGRTFGAKYIHKDRRFEIVPEEIDGILMPSEPFLPKEGDRYGVFETALPESYIRSAEGRLLDSAVQYLEGLETSRYSYRAAMDPLWLKKQWTEIGHKVRIGAYVQLAGDPITDGGATLRITGIKEYLTDPYAPEVTLSDRATGRGGLTSIIRKAVQEDLTSTKEASTRTAVEQARRTFHKAEQLTDALEKALGAHFEAMVRPLAVHTMQVLVGDKSLQFAYVESPSSTKEVPLPLTFDTATKSLHIDQAYLQHKTLGVEVTTAHTAKDFRTWTIAPIDYSPKGTAPLYLYARVPREGDGGTFVIDTKAHDFDEEAGYYHLWSGMLTPTDDGTSWEYMPMHGFTEITPGMISSPRFTSPDGRLVIDMVRGYFRFKTDKSTFSINADNPNGVYIRGGMTSVGGQNLTLEDAFEEQERKLKAEAEARAKAEAELEGALEGLRKSTGDEQAAMAEILGKVNKTLTSLQEQVDNEVSNWFYPGAPGPDKEPENEWITNQDKYRHIGDTYTSVDESGDYMGKSWRYTTEYKWQEIHDTLISKALSVAAKAQTTADGKSTTYYTQPSRYSVGDSWVLAADTTVGGKVYKKGTMLFANSSSDVYVGAHWSDILKYIDSAKLDADLKASEAKSKQAWEAYAAAKASKAGEDAVKAAKEYAEAQDAAYEERTKAYADKILTEKEQALIAAADAKANLAEKRAKAYADGKITETERLAIDKAAAAYKAAVKRAKELDSEIQVGGRNLLLDTSKEERRYGGYSVYKLATPISEPGKYILSFDCEVIRPPFGDSYCVIFGYQTTLQKYAYVTYIEGATHYEVLLDVKRITQEGLPSQAKDIYIYPNRGFENPTKTPDCGEFVLRNVKLERGTVATDWTPAPEDLQAAMEEVARAKAELAETKSKAYADGKITATERLAIDKAAAAYKAAIRKAKELDDALSGALSKEINAAKDLATKAQTSTDNLKGYVDGAYKDGIITEVESKAIATYINEVEAMWSSAFGAYERVYSNALLTGAPKTALADAKITLAGAKDNLVNQIKSAISDGKATKAEATETERLYNVYKGALRDFQKALKTAEESIRDAGKTTGGRNLLLDTGKEERRYGGYSVYKLATPISEPGKYILSFDCEVIRPPFGDSYCVIFGYQTTLQKYAYVTYIEGATHYEVLLDVKRITQEGLPSQAKDIYIYPNRGFENPTKTPDCGEFVLRNVKLERGTVATDWTPAPEDLQAEIDAANANPPRISDGGMWEVYDPKAGKYIDTGRTSKGDDGKAPIIKDGNWWEWDAKAGKYTDTGIRAIGKKGDKGDGLEVIDTRNDNQPPSWYRTKYPRTTVRELKYQSKIGIPSKWIYGSYCTLETTVRWADTSGGRVEQSTTLDNGVQLRRVGTADDTDWEPWINVSAQVQEINRGLSSAKSTISTLEQAQADLDAGKLNKADLPDVQYLLSSLQDGSLSHKGGLFLANDIILSDPKSKDVTAMISGNGAPGAKSIRLGIDKSGGVLGGETTALSNEGTGHIGGLYFDGDSIGFGDKDSRYMQIGGTTRSESEMVNASTEMQTLNLGGSTSRESGRRWVDDYIIETDGAKGIRYTATLSVRADASAYQGGDDRYDTVGGSIGRRQSVYSETTCTVKGSLRVVRYRAGSETVIAESQELTVTATAPGGRYDAGDPIPHDDLFASASKELAVTMSILESSVAKGDMLSLYIDTSISRYCYHPTGNSNLDRLAWASASVGDLSKRVPVDTSKPMISVAKDRAAFFYGRNSYLLLNYIQDTVLKVVGDVLISGDLRVTGDISSGNFLVPKVLAHGVFSKYGNIYPCVAYDSEPGTFSDRRLTCSRVSEGKYRLGFPAEWTGYRLAFQGTEQDSRSVDPTSRFVAFGTPDRSGYVYVYGADDSSPNDVAVYFQIIRMI